MAQGHPTAAAMASYTRSRLPFARPQTLQNPPNPPKVRPAPQGKGTPTSPTRATPARKSHHKATAMAQEHPTAAAMASYTRSRLPFARPQTLQNPPKPSKPSKSPASSAEKVPQQAQHAPLPHAKATTRPQQWLKGTPRPQQWLLIRVQGCRLPGLKRSKTLQNPPNPPKVRPAPQGKGTPTSPTRATPARKSHHKATAMAQEHPTAAAMASYNSRTQKPPQGHSNGSRAPHGRSNGFLYAFKAAVCQASNAPKPSKTLQTLQKSGQLRRKGTPTSPTRATPARKSHHKATAMAQGHPTAAAMASYTRSRLPFARPQTLQNPPKPSKPSKSPASSARKRYPNKPNTRHSRTQKPPQGHSNGSRAPHGRSNGFLYAFKAAVCQASNAPKPSKTLQTLQKSGQLRKEKVPQQAQHAPLPHAKATTRPQQWLKSTPRPQQWLLIRVQGCRLPGLKRSKTLQNPPNPPKVRPAPQGKGTPTSPTRATAARKSHHKATAMAQGHPTAAAMASYTRSRLPFARPHSNKPFFIASLIPKSPFFMVLICYISRFLLPLLFIGVQGCRCASCLRKTLQNPPNPPKGPRKGTPTSPTRATFRTQKPPQGHSNGCARAPHGRSNGFLYAFKAAVCQASNAPKPSKTLQTLQKSGQLRKEKVPQQAQHAPLPHAKATTRPQQWLKGTPRPQQWLLITPARKSHHKATAMAQEHPTAAAMASYTRSRLPFARPQTLQNPPKPSKPSKSPASSAEKVPQQAQHAPLPHAKATTRPQQWLKGTPRPQQWLLIRVQGCRLPGLKRSKTLQNPPNPPKVRPAPQGKGTPTSPTRATPARKSHHKATAMAQEHPTAAAMASYNSRTQKPPQGHSNGSRAPHGRSNGFLYAFKAAVCLRFLASPSVARASLPRAPRGSLHQALRP